jgi:hypothetical protein
VSSADPGAADWRGAVATIDVRECAIGVGEMAFDTMMRIAKGVRCALLLQL